MTILPWYIRWGAVILAMLSSFGVGFVRGMLSEQSKGLRAELDAVQVVIKHERQQQAVSNLVDTKHQADEAKARTIYTTITKEVIKYVSNPDHGVCRLDGDWLRLYNSAIMSRLPDATGIIDATSSGIDTDQLLINAQANYEACNATARRLSDLQEWVTKQKQLSDTIIQ